MAVAAAPCLEAFKRGVAQCYQCPLKTLALTAGQAHKPLLEGVPFQVDVGLQISRYFLRYLEVFEKFRKRYEFLEQLSQKST